MGYLGNFRAKPSSIVTADIAAGQITTALIADDGITAAKIADDAVVSAAIGANQIGSSELNLGANYAFTGTVTGARLTPAFEAHISATQTVAQATDVKCPCNTEVIDTDGCYDNSTNYRFTPTTAGKYFVYGQVRSNGDSNSSLSTMHALVKKNGSIILSSHHNNAVNFGRIFNQTVTGVIDMNGSSDYIELWGNSNRGAGSNQYIDGNATMRFTHFGAFRISA